MAASRTVLVERFPGGTEQWRNSGGTKPLHHASNVTPYPKTLCLHSNHKNTLSPPLSTVSFLVPVAHLKGLGLRYHSP